MLTVAEAMALLDAVSNSEPLLTRHIDHGLVQAELEK